MRLGAQCEPLRTLVQKNIQLLCRAKGRRRSWGDVRRVQTEEDGTSSRNISLIIFFLIAPPKACPTSSAMLKSRNIAISASSPISRDVSGTSVDTSLPRRRIIIAIFAERAG